MTIRPSIACAAVMSVLFLASPTFSRAQGPARTTNAQVQQPDSVVFQRAMKAMKQSRFAEARTLLNSLIRSYPDSDFVPRAKLAIGDAWYAEGAFRQAEMEYQDFMTFFPKRPEVAGVKSKLDSIQKR
jgi:outer membrane protein assembly factor BamD (BamD/ComL family)